MKKFLSLLTVVMVALQLSAAPVDLATAQATAEQYLASKVYVGKYMAPGATSAQLIFTQMGDKATTPVFYIFNTETTYVIVSGDDRAEEVLAYGDKPLNLDRIPDGLQYIMDMYKEQLDWLLTHPDVEVEKPVSSVLKAGETYGPLLTCNWDQTAPYWNKCKFTYNGSSYQCLTGCPATSASMVLYYWKYPTTQIAAIPSYTASLDLSYYNSVNFTYPALEATTFDWANMKDSYSSYTTAQGNAVATLMRYVGQAEHMMYGTSSAGGSGIYTTDTQNIVDMFTLFGYNSSTCRVVKKSSYSETNWATLLQNEMAASRPVVFMAVDNSAGGHAFNVDGYNSSTNKYHVNFGWSGDGNNWMAMNAFSDGDGYTFNQDQQMVIGIQPPQTTNPTITVSNQSLTMNTTYGSTATATFTVTGANLTGNITATLTDANGVFSVNPTTITVNEATNGKTVTVTFAPQTVGTFDGSILLKSANASNVIVSLTGTSTGLPLEAPVLNAASNVTLTSFNASWTYNPPTDVTYNLKVNKGNYTILNKTGITDNNYTVTGLTAGTTYTFVVRAVPVTSGIYTSSAWSNSVTVTLTEDIVPTITVEPVSLDFGTVAAGQSVTQTFNVKGTDLAGDITLALTGGNGAYSLSTTTITAAQAQATSGKQVTVTFTPSENVTYNGTIKLTSTNATAVNVALTGAGAYSTPVMLAADEEYIKNTSFRANWTDATPSDKVASYTLEVSYVAPEPEVELIGSLAGTSFTSNNAYYDITLPAPWGGTNVRGGNNSIIYFRNNYQGSGTAGNITYTIPEGYDNATFTMKITTGSTSDGAGNLAVGTPQTSSVNHYFSAGSTYAWVVTASSGEKITITTSDANYSPDIALIEVYTGDATALRLRASETGNETYRLIEGVTDLSYVVNNLLAAGTFTYRVKAIYTNGSESEWSNEMTVTLSDQPDPEFKFGDVTGDGAVDIDDVNAVINIILNVKTEDDYPGVSDLNDDNSVDVDDMNIIINIILSQNLE